MEPQFKGNWYPGLDGVRAIAVILVFTTHTIPHFTANIGWMGVQIFFVLSGFLITGILFDNRNQPNRWKNFYARRALRIFPLYYFVWLVIALLTPFLHLQWHGLDALWPLYVGNYIPFLSHSNPLIEIASASHHFALRIGHFWSLAVEEQFYFLWPLIVFSVGDRKKLTRICQVGIVAVLALRIALHFAAPAWMLHRDLQDRITFTQADSFMIGGLLALWMRGPERERLKSAGMPLFLSALSCLVALKVIYVAFFHERLGYNQHSPWISTWGFTIIDLSAAGLILAAMTSGTWVHWLTTLPFLRRLGTYSYGFYVYHLLLLPFVLSKLPRRGVHGWYALDALCLVGYFFAVFAVSALSYHFLEMPFLRLKGLFGEKHRNPQLATAAEPAAAARAAATQEGVA